MISLNVLVAFLAFEVPHCTDDVMRSDASTRTGTKRKNTARVTAGLNLLSALSIYYVENAETEHGPHRVNSADICLPYQARHKPRMKLTFVTLLFTELAAVQSMSQTSNNVYRCTQKHHGIQLTSKRLYIEAE